MDAESTLYQYQTIEPSQIVPNEQSALLFDFDNFNQDPDQIFIQELQVATPKELPEGQSFKDPQIVQELNPFAAIDKQIHDITLDEISNILKKISLNDPIPQQAPEIQNKIDDLISLKNHLQNANLTLLNTTTIQENQQKVQTQSAQSRFREYENKLGQNKEAEGIYNKLNALIGLKPQTPRFKQDSHDVNEHQQQDTKSTDSDVNNLENSFQLSFKSKLDQMINGGGSSEKPQSSVISNVIDQCLDFKTNFNINFNDQYDLVKIDDSMLEFNYDENKDNVIKFTRFNTYGKNLRKTTKDLFPSFSTVMLKRDFMCSNGYLTASIKLEDYESKASYGIIFRYQNYQNYLTFQMMPKEQKIQVRKIQDGKWTILYDQQLNQFQTLIPENYNTIEIRFQNQDITIDFASIITIKVKENQILTGNVGLFFNQVQEAFVKQFEVVSLSSQKYQTEQDKQLSDLAILKNKESKRNMKLLIDDTTEYQIDTCYKKAIRNNGCDNYRDDSCFLISCKGCCNRYEKDQNKCQYKCDNVLSKKK